jgi:hypothetical protein
MTAFNYYDNNHQLIRRSIYFTKELLELKQVVNRITLYSSHFINKNNIKVYDVGLRVIIKLDLSKETIDLDPNHNFTMIDASDFELLYIKTCPTIDSLNLLIKALDKVPLYIPVPIKPDQRLPSFINPLQLNDRHSKSLNHISKKSIASLTGISRPTVDKYLSNLYDRPHHSYLWNMCTPNPSCNFERQEVVNRIMFRVNDLMSSGTHRSVRYTARLIVNSLYIKLPLSVVYPIIKDHLDYRNSLGTISLDTFYD